MASEDFFNILTQLLDNETQSLITQIPGDDMQHRALNDYLETLYEGLSPLQQSAIQATVLGNMAKFTKMKEYYTAKSNKKSRN